MKASSSTGPTRLKSESYRRVALIERFLRKRLVGKSVHVLVDYIKPREGDYEERECVTITYGNQNK
jgi:staphylococcal nuclease domain-containing protein 1